MANAKTFSMKPADVTRKWHVIDASEAPLGRVATQVAILLMGKDKPEFTPHVDGGDYVILVNASQLRATGNKHLSKTYYRHTGFPGGIKDTTLREQIEKDPTKVIHDAVRGMMPSNKLRPDRLARLKIYAGAEHSHEAQKPTAYPISKGDKK